MSGWVEEEDITRLFKIRRTVMQMLGDRGYKVEDSDLSMTRLEFFDKFGGLNLKRQDLTYLTSKPNNPTDQIYVFFPDDPKVGVKILKTYIKRSHDDNVFRSILVVQNNLTPSAKAAISATKKFQVEVFHEAELVVNIKNHTLVPDHRVLSPDDKKALLERYALKETQLPQMKVTDPMAKYYGLKRGQIVKIIRDSELAMDDGYNVGAKSNKPITAGKSVTYRYVV